MEVNSSLCSCKYSKYITFKNYIFEYKLIKYAYSKLEKVNSFYIVGRNKLLTEMGKLTYSALSPFPTTQSYRPINRPMNIPMNIPMNKPINVRQNISTNEGIFHKIISIIIHKLIH